LLRHDNADLRLTPISKEVGLCSDPRWERFEAKRNAIDSGRSWLEGLQVHPGHNPLLESLEFTPVKNKMSLFEFLRRPEISYRDVLRLGAHLEEGEPESKSAEVWAQLELGAKFDGYIQMQERDAARQRALGNLPIPAGFDYQGLKSLSYETVEKLSRIRPTSVGQASRVPGVRPSDIALLIGFLR
jgi:tRNA uridine 5-carboxymethylaminomethyl modification enzyme